eukprot:PRCOL_00003280-RA
MNNGEYVRALAWDTSSGSLYVGGSFGAESWGGTVELPGVWSVVSRIVKWDGAAWSALGWDVSTNSGEVYALAWDASSGSLYVGGYFSSAGGVSGTSHIAKWDGAAWSALGSSVDSYVRALAFTLSICAAGTIDASSCYACPPGMFVASYGGDTRQCEPCGANTYNAATFSATTADCLACPAGQSSDTGSTACSDCPAGTYADAAGEGCKECPAGTSSALIGATASSTCEPCAKGLFQPLAGQSTCEACAIGTTTASTGLTSCADCAANTFTPQAGEQCYACGALQGRGWYRLDGASATQTWGAACAQCAKGSATDATDATACSPCGAGTYADAVGAAQCTNCPAGTFVAGAGSTSAGDCAACGSGRTSVAGASACTDCTAGTYGPSGINPECEPCPANTFSDSDGAVSCTACPASTTSPAGSTSASACVCGDSVMVAARIDGVLTCACPAGTRTAGSDACEQCELGTYADRGGLDTCKPCPAGATTQRLGATAADECACPPNSALVADRCVCLAGFEGMLLQPGDACAPCGIGSFKSLPGPAQCDACPPGATTADVAALSDAECQCVPGSYPERTAGGGEMSCSSCPTGANCSSGGAPSGMAGYWRENMSSPVFYSCPFPTACLPEHAPRGHGGGGEDARAPSSSARGRALLEAGVEDATDSSWRCDYGYDGMLCAVCEPGYGYSEGDGCSSCQASGSVWVGAMAGALALALVVVLLYWLPFLPRLDALVGGVLKRIKSVLARLKGIASCSAAFAKDNNSKTTQLGRTLSRKASEAVAKGVAETAESVESRLERSSFAAHARVLIAFVQVVATVDVTFDIRWPRSFLDMVKALKVINLDVLALPSVRCSLERWNFFDKLRLWCCAPAAFGVVTLLLFVVGRLYARGDEARRPRLARFRANVWRNSLFALFLVYPILSATLLRTFHCREVDGVRWLSSDLRLRCDTAAHDEARVIASIGIALYVVGIPLFFWLIMLHHGVRAIAARHHSRAVARNALLVGIALNEDADEVDAVLGMEMRRLLRERATLEQLFEGEVRVGTRLAQTLVGDETKNAQRPGGDTSASPESKAAEQGEDGPASPGSGKASRAASFADDDGAAHEALVAWAAAHAPIGELCFGANSSASARGGVAGSAVGPAGRAEEDILADGTAGPLDADEALAIRHCGQLFASYHTRCWYWELVEMIRKFVLTGALVFVDAGGSGQVAVGLLVACVFLVANVAFSPHADNAVDFSAQTALVEIALILFAGLLVKVETVGGTNDRLVIGALLVITSGIVFAMPVLSAVLTHGAAVRRAARAKLSKLRSARVARSASQKAGEGEEDEGKVDEGAAGDTAAPSPEP